MNAYVLAVCISSSIQNSKYNVMAFLGEEIPADEK